MSAKEKLFHILWNMSVWILLWCLIEWLIPGDVENTTIRFYAGAVAGYIICVIFNPIMKNEKSNKN